MMFTMPQGGWDNAPVDDRQWPADFTIDYVRAWQLKERMEPETRQGALRRVLDRNRNGIRMMDRDCL